jgi:Mor family transcriptional regulator
VNGSSEFTTKKFIDASLVDIGPARFISSIGTIERKGGIVAEELSNTEEFQLSLLLVIVEVLADKGVKHSAAVLIGKEITKLFCRREGGLTVYVPKGVLSDLAERAANIYLEFDGGNYFDLARKYNLSEVQVRSILKRSEKALAGHRKKTLSRSKITSLILQHSRGEEIES